MSRSGAAYLVRGQAWGGVAWAAGSYQRAPFVTTASTITNPTDGTMRLSPIWVPNAGGVTLVRISCETVTTPAASGGVIRLGVYADGNNGLPGALTLDAGTVDSTAAAGVLEITISLAVGPGLFWTAAVPQGTPATAATMRDWTVGLPVVGAATANTTPNSGAVLTGVTGALPGSAAAAVVAGTVFATWVKVAA